jgi:hypothetical protein
MVSLVIELEEIWKKIKANFEIFIQDN